jgi:FkbM family methyltransferase
MTMLHKLIGKFAGPLLRKLPAGTRFPILSGPNRGLQWMISAGLHRCWLGAYEPEMTHHIVSLAKPGMTVFDVGAHAGYFTMMLSRIVGKSGRVFAFEANPENVAILRKHIRINQLGNINIIEAAVADRNGEVRFSGSGYEGQISDSGRRIPAVKLVDFPTPDLLKMDIEGAEILAFAGATRILSELRTKMLVAVHEGEPIAKIPTILTSHTYKLEWINERELIAIPAR